MVAETVPDSNKQMARVIGEYWQQYGYSPSMRELMELGFYATTSAVSYRLDQMLKRGLLTKSRGKARAFALTEMGWKLTGLAPRLAGPRMAHLKREPCPHCGYNVRHSVRQILTEVAEEHEVSLSVMLGKSRRQAPVHARDCAIKRLDEELGLGPSAIGTVFQRHHTTVIHALKKATDGK